MNAGRPAVLSDALAALEAGGFLPAETRRERGGEVRGRGSLSVNRNRATFRDREAGTGGGVTDLIEHLTGRDRAGALDYLREPSVRGFERSHEKPRRRRNRPKRPQPHRTAYGPPRRRSSPWPACAAMSAGAMHSPALVEAIPSGGPRPVFCADGDAPGTKPAREAVETTRPPTHDHARPQARRAKIRSADVVRSRGREPRKHAHEVTASA